MIDEKTGKEIFEEVGCNEFVRDAYADYGAHIMGSGFQVGRQFTDINDGLKISYRHALQALWEAPDRFTKTVAIVGDMLRKYHFTGDASIGSVIYSLVNDYKCVEGQGNLGGRTMTESISGAAERYTEVKLKKEIREQLDRIMPYIPEQTTITGFKEKLYIPTPVPLAMIAGTGVGMGIGMANNLPPFTAKSMLEAYLADDPSKLRLNYGYTLGDAWEFETDTTWFDNSTNEVYRWVNDEYKDGEPLYNEEPSEENLEGLQNIWNNGRGSIEIGVPMYYSEVDGQIGIMCVCDPKLHAPYKSDLIYEWEEAGYIEVFDFSDEIGKMFFSITKGTRKITIEMLWEEVYYNCGCFKRKTFTLNVSTGKITGKVGLGQWIDYTYRNYERLYNLYIENELSKLDFNEALWTNFVFVADKLIKFTPEEMSTEDIVKACNSDPELKKLHKKRPELKCTEDIVYAIGQKAINTLRNAKVQANLDKIQDSREYYNNLDVPTEIVNFVECWDSL